ncbi:hypothetical protein [Aliiroseovarius sp.]|uniref:hypothetical protein n=1 Tax=Aliiroseovarius sp. TaxID=1872442 RepID=UPI003BA8449B
MKWVSLTFGIVSFLAGWATVQIGKGVAFTHGNFTVWNDAFLDGYNSCCLLTDLRTATPFFLLGTGLIAFSLWRFLARR